MIYVTIKTLSDGRIHLVPQGNGFMYANTRATAEHTSARTGGATATFRNERSALDYVLEANRRVRLPTHDGVVGYVGAEGCYHAGAHRNTNDTYSSWNAGAP